MAKAVGVTEAVAMIEGSSAVDSEELEERAGRMATASFVTEGDLSLTELAIRCTDLTSLNEDDTSEKIAGLCARALRPDPADTSLPSLAAVCVYPEFVPMAVRSLAGTPVKVAGVAGGFPSGDAPTAEKLREIREVLEMGADEVDTTLNRAMFRAGDYGEAFEEIAASKEACGDAILKVILETGALGSYDEIRRASLLVMAAGADFVKTSTGKTTPGATLPAALCIMEAIRDVEGPLGRRVGMKVSGGVREAETARRYLLMLRSTLGPEWMHPDLFRLGASSLLDHLVREVRRERSTKATGRY
ncbi:MAG TPA: deoxyribose-phosphate aldolase [Actinomycetota bacterium]|nr:deoxyribose-phosphate aldolase [Actinomycetota bacterium]